jgi:hypothetical protein
MPSSYRSTRRQGINVLLLSLALFHSANAFVNPRSSSVLLFEAKTRGAKNDGSRLFVAAPRKQQQPAASKADEDDAEKAATTKLSERLSNPPRFVPPTPHDENRGSKFRKLKDMIWIRETVEDLTAAEFACSVEAYQEKDDRKRRRAVDYDKLLAQLNKRLRDLGCGVDDSDNEMNVFCELEPSVGMGTTVYNTEERQELFE